MEVSIVILFKLVTLHQILFDPILVSNRLLGVRVELRVDGKEFLLELLDLVEVFLLLLFIFSLLLFFILCSCLLSLFLVNRLLNLLGFILIRDESRRRELASDLTTVLSELLRPRLLCRDLQIEHGSSQARHRSDEVAVQVVCLVELNRGRWLLW